MKDGTDLKNKTKKQTDMHHTDNNMTFSCQCVGTGLQSDSYSLYNLIFLLIVKYFIPLIGEQLNE